MRNFNLTSKMGTIIYIVGLVLAIIAALEIFKLNGDMIKKIIAIVVVLLTSWVGLAVYFFFARTRIAEWVK